MLIRPHDGVLAMHTMRFADELVAPSKSKLARVSRKPTKREIEMAAQLVEGLHVDFQPHRYKDTYRRAVLKVIERKAAGKKIEVPRIEEPEPADDLVATLEASMNGGGKRKRRAKGKRTKAAA